jgi:hypothetical protein
MKRPTSVGLVVQVACAALVTVAPVASTFAQSARRDLDESWWAAIGPDGVQRVNVRCGPNFLDPRNIVVRANVPLQISVSTTGDVIAHNFTLTIGRNTIDAPVDPAQKSFIVSPSLSGRFEALCRDTSRPDSPAAQAAKTATFIVVP